MRVDGFKISCCLVHTVGEKKSSAKRLLVSMKSVHYYYIQYLVTISRDHKAVFNLKTFGCLFLDPLRGKNERKSTNEGREF
jgi:hypothetical protein